MREAGESSGCDVGLTLGKGEGEGGVVQEEPLDSDKFQPGQSHLREESQVGQQCGCASTPPVRSHWL